MAKRGRKRKGLTEKQWEEVKDAMRVGMTSITDLAGLIGVSVKRMKREMVRLNPRLPKKMEMRVKKYHITRINQHERNWTASAWWLERKYPTEFGITRADPEVGKDKLIMTRKVVRKTVTTEETSDGKATNSDNEAGA